MLQLESQQVLDADVTELDCTVSEAYEFSYRLTDDEQRWLDWIGDRYWIAVVVREKTTDGVLTITTEAIADALADDGVDRAPCLSEDTALARIVWLCCRHGE